VRRQVLGVADASRAPLLAEALRRLGTEHALVVHGEAGMDEIAPRGRPAVWEVREDRVTNWTIDPAEYDLDGHDLAPLEGGDPRANADRIRALLSGGRQDRTGRAAVILNAAAALYVAGLARDLREGVERASAALDDGSALRALDRLVAAQAPGAP
jgi:anthranilate phosphoribosyltransferase